MNPLAVEYSATDLVGSSPEMFKVCSATAWEVGAVKKVIITHVPGFNDLNNSDVVISSPFHD